MAWSKSTRITTMVVIDTLFFLLEIGVGLVVGSLALLADAFHMLNDIISLLVGLWAVKAAQRSSSDKYSFGWLRAEILGAFFNAVFLIALCLSIVLEAITRLIDPPEISRPMLILIVGSMGLFSNIVGFFVLGGHGHSHGPGGHDHTHDHSHGHSHGDEVRSAEEGHAHSHAIDGADESGVVGDVLPEVAVARATHQSPGSTKHIKFTEADEDDSTFRNSDFSSPGKTSSKGSRRYQRRSSRSKRFGSIDDISIHPAGLRRSIIAASQPALDGIQSEDGSDSEAEEAMTDDGGADNIPASEVTPLLRKVNYNPTKPDTNGHDGHKHDGHDHDHVGHDHGALPRRGSAHSESDHTSHNHNKPRKAAASHGHSHDDMGMRAMVLHVVGDALGNVGVIASALIIWLTHSPYRFYADPAVSLFITLIILRSTIPLTTATAKILLQATPDHLDVQDIKADIQSIPGVASCHHVHIWQLSDSQIVASMHVQVAFPLAQSGNRERYMNISRAARKCLHAYGIHSATIQPEFCLDETHEHAPDGTLLGFEGAGAGSAGCSDEESCMLECVDDCRGRGCCASAVAPSPTELAQNHDAYVQHAENGGESNGHGH